MTHLDEHPRPRRPVDTTTEHRARCCVAHHLADDPAGALEVLEMLGLVDDQGRAATTRCVGEVGTVWRD